MDILINQRLNVVVTVKLDTIIPNDLNADWVKEHVAQYGKEPEFF